MKLQIKLLLVITTLIPVITGCSTNYVDYHSHIESPSENFIYGLYLDGVGIGDPGYYVLKIEKHINSKEVYVAWNMNTGVDRKALEWFDKRTVLFNYDEAGYNTEDPGIEIFNNRFLVIKRRGCIMDYMI